MLAIPLDTSNGNSRSAERPTLMHRGTYVLPVVPDACKSAGDVRPHRRPRGTAVRGGDRQGRRLRVLPTGGPGRRPDALLDALGRRPAEPVVQELDAGERVG